MLWLKCMKKVGKYSSSLISIMSSQSLQQSKKQQHTVKQRITTTMKPSGLNTEPSWSIKMFHRQISIPIPKIEPGVSVLLFHRTPHLHYFIINHSWYYSHSILDSSVDVLGVKCLK